MIRCMKTLLIKDLGTAGYLPVWQAMRRYTERRGRHSPDQIWFVQHPLVYTLGLAGREEHLLDVGDIPVIRSDRGGQVSCHGPGQLLAYPLLDLGDRGLLARTYIHRLEQAVIRCLAGLGITGQRRTGMPGVYVGEAKIAALGIRIRRQYCYHGVALNIHMAPTVWQRINPCGYPGLKVTQLAALGVDIDLRTAAHRLCACLLDTLGYSDEKTRIAYPGGWQLPQPGIPVSRPQPETHTLATVSG